MDAPGEVPGPDAREALERLLLDGPRRYTRLQVAELAGMEPTRTQRLWRALGFPDAADDDPAFTDADVQALGVLSSLIDSGFVGPDTEGQGMQALADALDDLRSRVGHVYVHLDLDILDAAKVGMANEYGIPGGMDESQLEEALDMVRERFTVAAAGIASYDPTFDADGSVLHAAIAGASMLTSPKTNEVG